MESIKSSLNTTINKQFQLFWASKCNKLSIDKQTVVIDFSSPNIAKPLHPGHLRATLLGSFIANINRFFGHRVHKYNYIGDWGTQFGYLLYGLKNTSDQSERLSMRYFYEVYIQANQRYQAEEDRNSIKTLLKDLENGNEELERVWRHVRQISMDGLTQIYRRLGIDFDYFEFESDYARSSKSIVEQLQKTNLISFENGAVFYNAEKRKVPLITKEGLSLYLTRDVSAFMSRYKLHKPDRIHYVVEDGQTLHFELLRQIITKLNYSINEFENDTQPKDFHIKFGRVLKMSTRKGNIIFLDDVFDNAKQLMLNKLRNEKKVTLTEEDNLHDLAENLGKTIVYCEFFRSPRQNPFDFVWDRDNLGFRLQYCRSSLNSLEKRCFDESIYPSLDDCFEFDNYSYFNEYPSGHELVKHLKRWDAVLLRCYMECESYYLLHYVTQLVGLINKALRDLRIITCPSKAEAEMRLKLFCVSKFILTSSFNLFGIPNVERI